MTASEANRWASHMPMLFTCLLSTAGPVLEIGCGLFSTPALSAFCMNSERPLVHVENDPAWKDNMRTVGLDQLPSLAEKQWSVVLVDHWPESDRGRVASMFVNCAEFVVIHDSESAEVQKGLEARKWKFAYTDIRLSTHTLVLSQKRIPL